MKIKRKIVVASFSLLLILTVIFVISKDEFLRDVTEPDSTIDMSIDREKEQHPAVLSRFMNNTQESFVMSEDLNQVARDFIPEDSSCKAIDVIGEVVYIDYTLEDVRYLVAYYAEG